MSTRPSSVDQDVQELTAAASAVEDTVTTLRRQAQANKVPIPLAIINESTAVGAGDVAAFAAALQVQITRDFAPVWGRDATVEVFGSRAQVSSGAYWWLAILDNSDQAGALGYHDLTAQGLPLGKIFAGTDRLYGTDWHVTGSHEALEMLADPYCALCVQSGGTLIAVEVSDPCEADGDGYQIGQITVSDFCHPEWWISDLSAIQGVRYDHRDLITAPLQLRPDGYISTLTLSGSDGWTQQFGQHGARTYQMRAPVGSRRERRRTPHHLWQVSRPR